MEQIAKKIKERREALGISQADLAERCGYTSRTSIAKIESGVIDLPQSKIIAIANALHVSPAYLMGWDNSAPEMPAPEDEQMKEFIRLFGKLTDQQRRSLIALMQSMIAARE